MRRRWGRWRGYIDELEEAMRTVGQQLSEAAALIGQKWERPLWRARQRESIDAEILRRALDVPFLRELIETAWRVGPEADLTPPDFRGREWREEESESRLSSPSRFEGHMSAVERAAPREDEPPARLRAVERALAARSRSLVVLLDDLVSARNVSAVVRSAEALGLQEVHMIQREGRLELERTISMQAQRWMDLAWYREPAPAIEALRERGYRILVSDFSPEARPLDEVPLGEKVALAFGSEQRGVSEALREEADGFFYIPSVGFTSYLNVSVAVGIALYVVDARMRDEGLRAPLADDDKKRLRRAWYRALAGGDTGRAQRYLAWVDDPPPPAEGVRGSRPSKWGVEG